MFFFPVCVAYRSCDLVGQLPLQLHGGERRLLEDSVQLSSSVSAHLLLQRAGLLTPLIQEMVREGEREGGREGG